MGNLTKDSIEVRIVTGISSAHGLVVPTAELNKRLTISSFTSATGTYQISDAITGGADSIDLQGALVDDLGDAITFSKVNAIHFENTSATGGVITLSTNFGGPITVGVQGGAYNTFVDDTGLSVIATSNDTITVTGSSGLTYNIVVIGIKG